MRSDRSHINLKCQRGPLRAGPDPMGVPGDGEAPGSQLLESSLAPKPQVGSQPLEATLGPDNQEATRY
jgi:hypothetical protein